MFGGRLYEEGSTPKEALPALFIELCAALAGLFAMACTAAVSLATKPLPEAHVGSLFRRVPATD